MSRRRVWMQSEFIVWKRKTKFKISLKRVINRFNCISCINRLSNFWRKFHKRNYGGVIEDRYEYDAFGNPYSGDLSGMMNLGYMVKPYDTSTGLYNYGFRDYKPFAVRFTTVDPIRDGNNWFAYVNNDPVNYVDLWGWRL